MMPPDMCRTHCMAALRCSVSINATSMPPAAPQVLRLKMPCLRLSQLTA